MRKTTKILTLQFLLMAMLVNISFVNVYATSTFSLTIEYDGEGVRLNGTVVAEEGTPVTIVIGKTNVNVLDIHSASWDEVNAKIEYVTTLIVLADGTIPETYVSLSKGLPSGECKVFASILGRKLEEVNFFDNIGQAEIEGLVNNFNEKTLENYPTLFTQENEILLSKLSANVEAYKELDNKAFVHSMMISMRPFEKDLEKNQTAAYMLVSAFNKACAFAELNEDDFLTVIKKHNEKYWSIPVGEQSEFSKLPGVYQTKLIDTLDKQLIQSRETLENIFFEELSVNKFKSSKTRDDLTKAIELYNDEYYKLKLSLLENSRFNEYYIAEIYNRILKKCNDCDSITLINELFEDSVKEVLNELSKDDYKAPSYSGGGGGYTVITNNAVTVDKTNNDKPIIFYDVISTHWAYDYIYKLYNEKIVSGVINNMFEPERNVNREEFVKMVVSALKIDLSNNPDIMFEDVSVGNYSYPYITAAVNAKYIFGISDNNFGFGMSISREDAAVVLNRVLSEKNIKVNTKKIIYNDMDKISDYAVNSVVNMSNCEIFKGNADNYFEPQKNFTRAEACAVIVRLNEILRNMEE